MAPAGVDPSGAAPDATSRQSYRGIDLPFAPTPGGGVGAQVSGPDGGINGGAIPAPAGRINGADFTHCLDLCRRAGFFGPHSLIFDGPGDEWTSLDEMNTLVRPYLTHA